MIAMTVKSAVAAYVAPHITKETKSTVSGSFTLEDGTLTYTLEAPQIAGVIQPVDLNDVEAVCACPVKGAKQSVKNPNVALSQGFTKLRGDAGVGFRKLLEHANTLAAPPGGTP